MGAKSGSAITVDKPSMVFMATTYQLMSRKIDAECNEILSHVKALESQPELFEGERASLYTENLTVVKQAADKFSQVTDRLRKVAAEQNEKLHLGIDLPKVDAEALAAGDKLKSVKNKKLSGK